MPSQKNMLARQNTNACTQRKVRGENPIKALVNVDEAPKLAFMET